MALPRTWRILLAKTMALGKGLARWPLSRQSLLGLLLQVEKGWVLRTKGQGKLSLKDFNNWNILSHLCHVTPCFKPSDDLGTTIMAGKTIPHMRVPTLKKKTSLVSHHLACQLQLNSLEDRAEETQNMEVRIQIKLPSRAIPREMPAYRCFLLPSWLA